MKILSLVFVLIFGSIGVSAQNIVLSPESSGISVIQVKWQLKSRKNASNPELLTDPFRSIEAPNNRIDRSESSQLTNLPQGSPKGLLSADPSFTTHSSVYRNYNSFLYTLKVKNIGNKAIKKVFWNYVVSETNTNLLISQNKLVSFVKKDNSLKPGKTATLTAYSIYPAISEINSTRFSNRLFEQAFIKRIEYVDGTVLNVN